MSIDNTALTLAAFMSGRTYHHEEVDSSRLDELGAALASATDQAQVTAYEAVLDHIDDRRARGDLLRGRARWLVGNVPAWLAERILEEEAEAWRLEPDLDPEPIEALRAPWWGPNFDGDSDEDMGRTIPMSDDMNIDVAVVAFGDVLAFGGAA